MTRTVFHKALIAAAAFTFAATCMSAPSFAHDYSGDDYGSGYGYDYHFNDHRGGGDRDVRGGPGDPAYGSGYDYNGDDYGSGDDDDN